MVKLISLKIADKPTGLTSLTLPASLEVCGYNAFSDNTELRTLNIECTNCDFGQDDSDEGAINLIKLNLKEGLPLIYYTNSAKHT